MIVVVQDYGAAVKKRSNCLWIQCKSGEKEICSDKIKEIHLYPSCSISADAIQLCMQKDIWILFLNKYGEPEGEILPFTGGSSPVYKRRQLLLGNSSYGVTLVKEFLSRKIHNRVRQLKKILRNKRQSETLTYLSTRIKMMEEQIEKIQSTEGNAVDEVRESLQGFEGAAGRAYFESISYLLPDEMKFSHRMRHANDIYNCVLNYMYGILYAKIKKISYKCRLDPYIGIMHTDSYNKPTFVYDFIEIERIICEELAFELCKDGVINYGDMEEDNGALKFSEQARKLLVSKFYEKMNQTCYYKKKRVSLERRIYLEMLDVAQRIGEVDKDVLAAV